MEETNTKFEIRRITKKDRELPVYQVESVTAFINRLKEIRHMIYTHERIQALDVLFANGMSGDLRAFVQFPLPSREVTQSVVLHSARGYIALDKLGSRADWGPIVPFDKNEKKRKIDMVEEEEEEEVEEEVEEEKKE
jgi:hypothetical protein